MSLLDANTSMQIWLLWLSLKECKAITAENWIQTGNRWYMCYCLDYFPMHRHVFVHLTQIYNLYPLFSYHKSKWQAADIDGVVSRVCSPCSFPSLCRIKFTAVHFYLCQDMSFIKLFFKVNESYKFSCCAQDYFHSMRWVYHLPKCFWKTDGHNELEHSALL